MRERMYDMRDISIHALREESDPWSCSPTWPPVRFQSTLSVRRATKLFLLHYVRDDISIHALREESDCAWQGF